MGRLDNPQTEGRLLLLAADFLTVLLLTAGTALAFLSGYGLKTDMGAVLVFCVFASGAAVVLHSLSRPWWALGTAAGIAGLFWLAWEDAAPALRWIGIKMNILAELYVGWNSTREEEFLPVFLLLCAALAWIMGWIAARARQWYLAALLSLTLVLPAIQMGVLPLWGAMLAAFAGWGAMLLTALYGRKDPGGLGRAQLLSLGGMCALVLVLVLALPMEGYLRPQWATDARTSMIQTLNRQLERFFDMDAFNSGILADLGLDLSLSEAAGGTGSGSIRAAEAFGGGQSRRENLLTIGPQRYQGRRIMEVETDDPNAPGQTVYLLGGTLNTYTGESWEEFPLSLRTPVTFFPGATAPEAEIYTMTVRQSNPGGTWYYPYRLVGGGNPDESGRLTDVTAQSLTEAEEADGLPDRGRRYEIAYCPGGPEDGFTELSGGWQMAEQDYRYAGGGSFENIYLDVPDSVRQTLQILLDNERWEMVIASLERELDTLDGDARAEREESLQQLRMMESRPTLNDLGGMVEITDDMNFRERFEASITAASRTAELLSKWAAYDLKTPAMEPGEDFVEHFLREGRGYCVHFATAGVLLLRMQGIPARYAAGYVADLNSQGYSRVLDSSAHAWAEIYLDGYGWYPVEMTPGYAGGESGVELAGAPDPEGEPDKPESGESPEDAPLEEPEDLPGEDLPDGASEAAGVMIPWRALGRITLILAALGGLYALALLERRREQSDADTNRSAINAYRRYARALRLGGPEDETMEALGRKARFSQHTLTAEEREAVWRCLETTREAARNRQKKRMRWLLSLLRPLL